MTKAVFTFTGDFITFFEVSGHTGTGEKGNDILCAFISGAVETAVNTITDSFKIHAKVTINKKNASVSCKNNAKSVLQKEMFHGLATGLRFTLIELSNEYPDGIFVADAK